MVPGFNTDFKYRGQTFHVQTEDNGVANPVVVSLLYHKGAILASRRTSYRELLEKSDCSAQLMEMMKSQHKALMRELLAGTYDAKIPGAAAPPAAPPAASAAETPVAAPAPVAATPVTATPVAAAPATAPPPAAASRTTRPLRAEPPLRPASAASRATPQPAVAARRPAASLDDAIMRYLEEHAAAAAAAR